jgi:hypothetical protein
MAQRRTAATVALISGAATIALAIALMVATFPRGLVGLAALPVALAAAWWGAMRRGAARMLGLGVGVALVATVVVLLVARQPLLVMFGVATLMVALAAARQALWIRVPLPPAPRPHDPVLFYNPRSGGGKAQRLHLPDEARDRGITPVELRPGDDLEALVRRAVAGGSDALAMAGGDGSQAIVAAIAAEHDLPYACIPAGTRNHFALDLGVDRDDVVGALDALVDGGERVVDLAEVNGRVFVNNVSLGLYAQAVQQAGYRDAKIRTLLHTVPDAVGPEGAGLDLSWHDGAGREQTQGAVVLVSNNRYRLGRAVGSGTRPRIDDGRLGVAVIGASGPSRLRQWTAAEFEVEAPAPVPAGVDGEAVVVTPPLRFRIRPAALRCRIARSHPGASPSAFTPDGAWNGVRALAGIALGHDPRPVPGSGATPTPPAREPAGAV